MTKYILIAIGAFALGVGGTYNVYYNKYANLQKEYSLLNDKAKFEYERHTKITEGIKEKYDEKYNNDVSSLNAVIDRLRKQRSEAVHHLESKLAASSNELNQVRVERTKLLDAIREYTGKVSKQFERCDSDRIALNNIKIWGDEIYSEK